MTNPYPGDTHWPADFQGCTIHGQYVDVAGVPVSGTINFIPDASTLLDYAFNLTIVAARTITATLDVNGEFTKLVPATDDPDISPLDWTYKVVENFPGGQTYHIEAPQNQTIELTQVTPVPSSTGEPIIRGPKGEAGSVTQVQGEDPDGAGHVDLTGTVLLVAQNLADITDKALARDNLDLGTAATAPAGDFLAREADLGDLNDPAAAVTNLGLDPELAQLAALLVGLEGLSMRATADWNTATEPGLYYGDNAAAHSPGANHYAGLVVNRITDTSRTQVLWRLATGADAPEIWMRGWNNVGGWLAWHQVFGDSGDLAQAPRAGFDGGAGYRKLSNVVYVHGEFSRTGGAAFAVDTQYHIADLPAGYRPALAAVNYAVDGTGAAAIQRHCSLLVDNGGGVWLTVGSTAVFSTTFDIAYVQGN